MSFKQFGQTVKRFEMTSSDEEKTWKTFTSVKFDFTDLWNWVSLWPSIVNHIFWQRHGDVTCCSKVRFNHFLFLPWRRDHFHSTGSWWSKYIFWRCFSLWHFTTLTITSYKGHLTFLYFNGITNMIKFMLSRSSLRSPQPWIKH